MDIKQKRYCKKCERKLKKNGKSKQGKQRWYCNNCKTSLVQKRKDKIKSKQYNMFLDWVLGKQSINESSNISRQSFSKSISWCWNIDPDDKVEYSKNPIVIIDGKWVGNRVCLIAMNLKEPIAWIFGYSENSYLYTTLFSKIDKPYIIITDGQPGIYKAIKNYWGNSVYIQRCQFHIKQNIKQKITNNPKLQMGKDLKELVKPLCKLLNKKQTHYWIKSFYILYKKHREDLEEKAPSKQHYKHKRHRSAYRQIDRLIRSGHMFLCVNNKVLGELNREYLLRKIPNTTNLLEGGINAQIGKLLDYHRGMTQEHQEKMVSWFLLSKTKKYKNYKQEILKDYLMGEN
jgi:hypothetical protein